MSFFVTGTDTGIGKTVATAFLAKKYQSEGHRVVTQSFHKTSSHFLFKAIKKT